MHNADGTVISLFFIPYSDHTRWDNECNRTTGEDDGARGAQGRPRGDRRASALRTGMLPLRLFAVSDHTYRCHCMPFPACEQAKMTKDVLLKQLIELSDELAHARANSVATEAKMGSVQVLHGSPW